MVSTRPAGVRFLCFLGVLCCLLILNSGAFPDNRVVIREDPAPGCRFIRITDSSRDLAVFIFKADLQHPGIQVRAALAGDIIPGMAPVESIARSHENENYQIAVAVNGGFFINSQPLGLMVIDGRLVKMGGGSSIVFSHDNSPLIDVFSCRLSMRLPGGEVIPVNGLNTFPRSRNVILYTPAYGRKIRIDSPGRSYILDPMEKELPASGVVDVRVEKRFDLRRDHEVPEGRWILWFGGSQAHLASRLKPGNNYRIQVRTTPGEMDIYQAVSGGPRLLRKGKVSVEREAEGQREGFDIEKHPRTAVGYSRDRRTLILAVADGRRPGYSLGMDLYGLARLMLEQGAYEAMNLDGGGSATMVVNGEVANRPSDITGPRPVAGALLIGIRRPDRTAAFLYPAVPVVSRRWLNHGRNPANLAMPARIWK
ncbi:MAG: phosphodiester glycosidase family protein [Candidatus Aminicenantes bacterium]